MSIPVRWKEKRKWEKGSKTVHFPELKKDMSLQIEEAHQVLSKINKNNTI